MTCPVDLGQSLFPAASFPDQRAQEPCGHGGKDEHYTWAQPRGLNLTKAESCFSLPEAAINVSLPTSSHSTGTWASGGGWITLDLFPYREGILFTGMDPYSMRVSSMPAMFLPATSSTDLLKASFTVTASEQETHFTK